MNKSRQFLLDDELNLLRIILVLGMLYRQTLSVIYFTELVLGSFGNVPVNKSDAH